MVELKVNHYYKFTYLRGSIENYVKILDIKDNTIQIKGYRKHGKKFEALDDSDIFWNKDRKNNRIIEEIEEIEFDSLVMLESI